MIKYLMLCACLAHFFLAGAQEFTTTRTNVQTFYERNDTLYTVDIEEKHELSNGDSVAYFPLNWTTIDDPNCTYSRDSTFFMGRRFVKRSGNKQWFFNKYGDTISFEVDVSAPKGSTFELMENDTLTFEAIYKEQIFLPSYRILDTVQNILVYEIEVKDTFGNLVEHPFQGKEFEIAQYFGFNITYNWWNFPNDTVPYYIAGIAPFQDVSGSKGLDFTNIFDIRPGFERHYQEEVYESDVIAEVRLYKLFAIDFDRRSDSAIITSRRTMWTIDPVSADSAFSIDTITEVYTKEEFGFLDKLNSQPGKYYSTKYNDTMHAIVNNHRWQQDTTSFIETVSRGYRYDENNDCIDSYHKEDTMVLGESLGYVYYRSDYSGNYIKKQLLYYKKGVQKWGDPIDFSKITGMDEPVNIKFSVYPNPFSGRLHIDYDDLRDVQITVFDMLGRKVYESKRPGPINTAGWSNGVYLVKISTAEGHGWKKVIKNGD